MVSRRGSDFLKRTIRNVVVFNDTINIIVKDIKEEGYKTINLVGESDLSKDCLGVTLLNKARSAGRKLQMYAHCCSPCNQGYSLKSFCKQKG